MIMAEANPVAWPTANNDNATIIRPPEIVQRSPIAGTTQAAAMTPIAAEPVAAANEPESTQQRTPLQQAATGLQAEAAKNVDLKGWKVIIGGSALPSPWPRARWSAASTSTPVTA